MLRHKLRHGGDTSKIPVVEQNADKDPAQLVHLPSLCQIPVLLVYVAKPAQWDHGYDERAINVLGGATVPHLVSCLPGYSLEPYLLGSPQQRLGWIWCQRGPVSAPAPGSSWCRLGFHWQQILPSAHLDTRCTLVLLGPE